MPTSLGPAEILVILVVALIVLGPKRLPEAGRQVGKALAEVRRWTTEVKTEMKSVIDIEAPATSTVVDPVVVSGTATSVDAKTEPQITDVVAPVAISADGTAVPVGASPADPPAPSAVSADAPAVPVGASLADPPAPSTAAATDGPAPAVVAEPAAAAPALPTGPAATVPDAPAAPAAPDATASTSPAAPDGAVAPGVSEKAPVRDSPPGDPARL